ncbi:MAG: cytochrome P450 [Candidatus Eremiobacteraeota bacterium]|nr:cytochrome P450 [Candidatus Eremiobacteraeota bacterium]
MASLKSKEITATKLSPGSSSKGGKQKPRAAKSIPGPSRWETLRRLYPYPFPKLPAFLRDIAHRYGRIVRFSLPSRSFVMLNDPEQIKDVLITQQHAFHKSEGGRALRWLLGDGLLTSEDPRHRQMRRIVQPAFHRERIEQYTQTMQRFADDWVAQARDGETIDIAVSMSALTLRIASETLFGVDADADAREVRDALQDTMEVYPLSIGPLGKIRRRLRFLSSTRRFENARARLDRILYRLIEERRAQPAARTDALSLLLTAEDPETGYHLNDEQVRDEAMTLFLAGHETTANALVWSWYLLAQNPDVEARLHADVDAGSLEYARRVLRESMRLYPPAWIVGREAQRDVTLAGGYDIPAKTTVFVCQLVLHRLPQFYREPLRFDPDRWLHDELPQFAYAPFGGGARRCIGEEFAWTEGALVLATIARRFKFRAQFTGEPEYEALVTLRPKGPMPMRVCAR